MLTPENFMSIWVKVMDEKEDKVCLIYLANDLVLKSDLRDVLKVQIAAKFIEMIKQQSTLQKVKKSIFKVVTSWHDQNLFDNQFTSRLLAEIHQSFPNPKSRNIIKSDFDCFSKKHPQLSKTIIDDNFQTFLALAEMQKTSKKNQSKLEKLES